MGTKRNSEHAKGRPNHVFLDPDPAHDLQGSTWKASLFGAGIPRAHGLAESPAVLEGALLQGTLSPSLHPGHGPRPRASAASAQRLQRRTAWPSSRVRSAPSALGLPAAASQPHRAEEEVGRPRLEGAEPAPRGHAPAGAAPPPAAGPQAVTARSLPARPPRRSRGQDRAWRSLCAGPRGRKVNLETSVGGIENDSNEDFHGN